MTPLAPHTSHPEFAPPLRELGNAASVEPADDLEALDIAFGIGHLTAQGTTKTQAKTPAALSAGDVDVLVALASQGKPYRARPTDLAAWMGVSGAGITRRGDRLVKCRMVTRKYDDQDRRICWITLTQVGLRHLRKETSCIQRRPLFASILQLPVAKRKTLLALLRELA